MKEQEVVPPGLEVFWEQSKAQSRPKKKAMALPRSAGHHEDWIEAAADDAGGLPRSRMRLIETPSTRILTPVLRECRLFQGGLVPCGRRQ